MDQVFSGLNWETCLFYLDDITVFSKKWEEYPHRLEDVFEHLWQAHLKLSTTECTLAAPQVCYLGYQVTRDGVLPDSSVLKVIWEILSPQNAKEFRSFLEQTSYYRRYAKNFADIALPLNGLTKKDAVYYWTPECQEAFTFLKHHLTTSLIIVFPDFSIPSCLYTDVSILGLGVVLTRVKGSKERIICCASCTLNQAEKNYPATK